MEEGIRSGLSLHRVEATEGRLRSFGLGLGAIFGLFAAAALRKHNPHAAWWLAAAPWPALLGLLRPWWLAPVYRPWMKVVSVIGFVNTFLLLGIIYFVFLTPFAIVSRLLGNDFLDEKLGTADTYWRPKTQPEGLESYERQF